MPRVRGHIVGEVAAFDPWLLSLSERRRAQVHEAFVAAVAATHRADLAAAAGVPVRDNDAELELLGRLSRLVERRHAGSGARRRARVVPGAPTCR